MDIKLNKYYKEELAKVAEMYDVKTELLEDLYKDIMRANFYTDICDIARENEEELKGEEDV